MHSPTNNSKGCPRTESVGQPGVPEHLFFHHGVTNICYVQTVVHTLSKNSAKLNTKTKTKTENSKHNQQKQETHEAKHEDAEERGGEERTERRDHHQRREGTLPARRPRPPCQKYQVVIACLGPHQQYPLRENRCSSQLRKLIRWPGLPWTGLPGPLDRLCKRSH